MLPESSRIQAVYGLQSPFEDLPKAIEGLSETELRLQLQYAQSALRAHEQRLQLVLEATHLATWEWDVSTDEICWSCNLEPVLGWTADTMSMTYKAWMQQVHPDDRLRFTLMTAFTVAADRDCVNEYRLLQPDGSFRWLQNKGRVFCDDDDQPLKVLGVTQQIDKLDRNQVEPLSEQFMSRHEFKLLKSRFIETVSHTFRTPLTIVQTAAELLDNYEGSIAKKQERFQQIYGAVQQITQFLDEAIHQVETEEL